MAFASVLPDHPPSGSAVLLLVHTCPEAIKDYIKAELVEGRIHTFQKKPVLHLSPVGITKPHQPGSFRMIVDLSAPKGHSISDGIHPELCSLEYATINQAAELDLRSAYHKVPIHPDDQPLLEIEWDNVTYIDKALPFKLHSAPKIFMAVADAAWAMLQSGVIS